MARCGTSAFAPAHRRAITTMGLPSGRMATRGQPCSCLRWRTRACRPRPLARAKSAHRSGRTYREDGNLVDLVVEHDRGHQGFGRSDAFLRLPLAQNSWPPVRQLLEAEAALALLAARQRVAVNSKRFRDSDTSGVPSASCPHLGARRTFFHCCADTSAPGSLCGRGAIYTRKAFAKA
jgi:hypothetical protein